jgi:TonB-dependent SusC/RagA subfamily outer membrane receptor
MRKPFFYCLLSLLFLFFSSSLLHGQEKFIQGKVTTFDSIPLIGASIQVKSSKEIVLTDTSGLFTVDCLNEDKLKVTARGFTAQNIKTTDNVKYVLVNLKLKPGEKSLEKAIGYGHVNDEESLYSISSLNENNMDFSRYRDIYELLRGRFPGVQIKGSEIVIRGNQTFHGSNAALLIVDGMEVDESTFGNLQPTNIKSIDVLKDGGAAIYGSQGANGVVLVETK